MDSSYIYTENEDKKSVEPLSFILGSSFPGFVHRIIKSQTNYYEKGSKDNRYSNFYYPLHKISTDDPKGCGYELPPIKSDVIYVYNNYNYTSSTSCTSLSDTSIFQYGKKSTFRNAIMNGSENSDDNINFNNFNNFNNYGYNHYPIQGATSVPTSMISAPVATPMVSPAPMATSGIMASLVTSAPMIPSPGPMVLPAPIVTYSPMVPPPMVSSAPMVSPGPIVTYSPMVSSAPMETSALILASTPFTTPPSMVSPAPRVTYAPMATYTPMESSTPMVASTPFTAPPSMVTSLTLPMIPPAYPAIYKHFFDCAPTTSQAGVTILLNCDDECSPVKKCSRKRSKDFAFSQFHQYDFIEVINDGNHGSIHKTKAKKHPKIEIHREPGCSSCLSRFSVAWRKSKKIKCKITSKPLYLCNACGIAEFVKIKSENEAASKSKL
ncbi:hypothetical protein DICPUDRAFT_84314 [Dictyostelium purpureum]|uniref:Uncharacterized protein n=1 Tax=Dictyostelium purpureum TaxID=5786 RepID=F1A291_DICPU|nr:uncharacterized protein DICPUDRAFT_84314 [Dictyostelium purpureum]EGC29679.1 hypothetical protein DICPUDRAFT_84314 [Dictyostelium purpureum]|eukprot:XP_003293784.1 hypothetical protein DICPUDRAFT_84314 [Dictyostelium purpureum]